MLKGEIVRGECCVLEFGELYFAVDARRGGRVVSVRCGANELLTDSNVNPLNFGSTFWTSPQADWGWPPVEAIDAAPYELSELTPLSFRIRSGIVHGVGPRVDGVSITKTFSANLTAQAVDVAYEIRNHDAAPKELAAWEITRVAANGLTFFATSAEPTGERPPPFTKALGAVWFQHHADVAPDSKLFADGQGWIAHVTPERLLLVKAFPDVAAGSAAPGEAEIEVFSSPKYVEVENQAAYGVIPPGGVSHWNVRWYLRQLPQNLALLPGDAELAAWVTNTLR